MKIRYILAAGLLSLPVLLQAQAWNGKKCAVVLTYDDALSVHLTNVIPALDSFGLKGTFYIANYNGELPARLGDWRKAAKNGHELANHTMAHPCEGGRPGREFVKPENDMNNYSVQQMDADILSLNKLLHSIDGKTERTFAFPCGDQKIHDTPYLAPLKGQFLAARGVMPLMPSTPGEINLSDVGCYAVVNQLGEELVKLVKEAENKNALLVFLFHGVGGGHPLDVSLQAHHELLRYLKQNEKSIWTATMIDVAKLAIAGRGKN